MLRQELMRNRNFFEIYILLKYCHFEMQMKNDIMISWRHLDASIRIDKKSKICFDSGTWIPLLVKKLGPKSSAILVQL